MRYLGSSPEKGGKTKLQEPQRVLGPNVLSQNLSKSIVLANKIKWIQDSIIMNFGSPYEVKSKALYEGHVRPSVCL
jgi:hypothetical protein